MSERTPAEIAAALDRDMAALVRRAALAVAPEPAWLEPGEDPNPMIRARQLGLVRSDIYAVWLTPLGRQVAATLKRTPAEIATRLGPEQRKALRLSLGEHTGSWPAGRVAAGLARGGLVEYAEHVDVWYGGRLTARRGYMATDLGRQVIAAMEETNASDL